MSADLEAVVSAALTAFNAAGDLEEFKNARLAHAGDKSAIALANRELATLPASEKSERGKIINEARSRIAEAASVREALLVQERDQRVLVEEKVDVTLPLDRTSRGGIHPLTSLREDISDLFIGMGYEVAEGPEIEAEWLNFDALNIPADHPARTMQDTLVLRTHTSPVQIRTMLERTPPIYVICPGRTFRSDELDATHTPVFNQVEGLVIDRGITMANLKGTLDHFATAMFGEGIVTRLRPSFFPFTEPSAEVDIRCFVCRGENATDADSCRTCRGEGWIEWGGCGMVNPKVLQACGVDQNQYSGFAFGMGLERTLMFRHGITDMRDIVEGDIRFTQHFGAGR